MIFGPWWCPVCKKTIQLGTVAPRGVMYRHCATKRHLKLAAEQEREASKQADIQDARKEGYVA